ncbi:unnamed protein product, partial [Brassica rapa]
FLVIHDGGETRNKPRELPKVLLSDERNKDFRGEPLIDGKAVPYDHKYHVQQERIRNKATANFARRRNYERIIANVARGSPPQCPPHMGDSATPPPPMEQNYEAPPPPNMGGQRLQPNYVEAQAQNNMGGAPAQNNRGGAPAQNNRGEGPPNAGCSRNNNNDQEQSGGTQQPQHQNNYPPKRAGSGNPYQG